jgi:lysophospholipase L1-like esterase
MQLFSRLLYTFLPVFLPPFLRAWRFLVVALLLLSCSQGPAPHTGTRILLSDAQFAQTCLLPRGSGYTRRSPFAELRVQTNATSLDLSFVATIARAFPTAAGIAVWDDTTFVGLVSDTSTAEQTKRVDLPGNGMRVLRFVEGAQAVHNDTTDAPRLGTFVTKVVFPAGSIATVLAPIPSANCLYVVGDSNSNGFGAGSNQRYGWLPLLRAQLGYDVVLDGWGYRSWTRSLGSSAQQDALVARIVGTMKHRKRKQVLFALGTNDEYLAFGSSSRVDTISTQVLKKLRTAEPTVRIFLQTPPSLGRHEHRRNSFGETMPRMRAALVKAAKTARGVTVVDGLTVVPAGQFAEDDVHFTPAGHVSAARAVYSILQ